MIAAHLVVEKAREYLGTPWHHAARVKGEKGGIDCIGLVICVYRELGVTVEDDLTYSLNDNFDKLLIRLKQETKLVPAKLELLQEGDILIFRHDIDMYNHCAIYSGFHDQSDHFIHAYNSPTFNKVVEQSMSAYWAERLHSVFRVKQVKA